MIFTRKFSEIKENELDYVGGKALSLSRLTGNHLPIPPGFVITTAAFNVKIDSDFKKDVLKQFDSLETSVVAVRSSAVAEDSVSASWAGQFDSFLNVGRDNLFEAIQDCWKSAESEVVKSYAKNKKIAKSKLKLAVVVQKMVQSEVSGVAFSTNPISRNQDEVMIEAIYGLGELLVQGLIIPDNYIINKHTLEIVEKKISNKSNLICFDGKANIEKPVLKSKMDKSCLDDKQIQKLTVLIKKIEKFYQQPQDIEWALEKNNFFIVQSRPITTL